MRQLLRYSSFLLLIFAMVFVVACSQKKDELVVAADGTGDFQTIQKAIDAVLDSSTEVTTIIIKPGRYKEKLVIPKGKNNIHFLGEDSEKTVITYDDYSGKRDINTFTSYTVKAEGNDLLFENLTIENSEGMRGQAVALHVEGDRCLFKNCRIIGNQDTVYAAGEGSRQYFKNCHIEGTTDFIFGSSTAVFEDCTILCKKHSYITAANTPEDQTFGYVFLDCRIEAAEGITEVYLGRPWRDYANVVFINCELGDHIHPEGWHNWSRPEREKTAFYAEYNNFGPGADTIERVAWSKQLTEEQAQHYTVENILNLSDWNLK